jgi:cytoskeleton protein RodZ
MEEVEQETFVSDPIGSKLKAAREAQGMSLDDVAAKTRVPIRHLLHMENGEWNALPAPTYSVGFARAYAGAVGLNASEIGSELRAQLGVGHKTPAAPYYEPADPARVPPRSLVIIVVVIMLVLVGAYLVWRNTAVEDVSVEEGAATSLDIPDAPPTSAPVGTSAAQPQTTAPATGPVVLTANSDVWVRISDAGGRRLLERTLAAGERYQVPGDATDPRIVTGRPNALQITVGATAIPPLGPPEQTVSGASLLPAELLARANQPATPTPPAR